MSYPIINSKQELLNFCKRKRKRKMVILSNGFLDKNDVYCSVCNKKIINKSNRVWVYPKQKQIVPMHYNCAWRKTFDDLFNKRQLYDTIL